MTDLTTDTADGRGFNWDLYLSIARFALPRLKYFREQTQRAPERVAPDEWLRKLDAMITAFELIVADCNDGPETPEQKQAIEKGLKEFARYYQELWY